MENALLYFYFSFFEGEGIVTAEASITEKARDNPHYSGRSHLLNKLAEARNRFDKKGEVGFVKIAVWDVATQKQTKVWKRSNSSRHNIRWTLRLQPP